MNVILTDKTQTWLELRAGLESEWTVLTLNARHSLTLIYVIIATHPRRSCTLFAYIICLSDDYERISAKHSSRLFLWTQPQYYGFFQMHNEYLVVAALEKAGGPMTQSRSWTAAVWEKARLTPPSTPSPKCLDPPTP